MTSAPDPDNEVQRLAWLRQSRLLDTPPEDAFDDITRLAAQVCGVPVAGISLIDKERQWFKSIFGSTVSQTPRAIAFCAHAILQSGVMVVPNARQDNRFRDNPFVTQEPFLRFYAAAPLVTSEGFALGTLFVYDHTARELTAEQVAVLAMLARQVISSIEMQRRIALQDEMTVKQLQLMAELLQTGTTLQESEQRLRLALESGNLGTFDLDLRSCRYLDLSAIWREQYGVPQDKAEFTADEWLQLIHPEDRLRVSEAARQAEEEHRGYQAEYRIMLPDSSLRWISAHATPLYGENNEPLRLVGVTQDITARKEQEAEREKQEAERVEAQQREVEAQQREVEGQEREATLARQVTERTQALLRQSQQTQLLLEAAGEGFFGIDLSGRNTFVNPAAASMLGYTVEELLGVPMHATLHHTRIDGRPYPREECPIYAAFTDGSMRRVADEVFWRKDGTSFPVEYVSTPVREEGQLSGAVVTFQDITQRQALETERQRLLAEAVERADRDPLTGLFNHRVFHKRFAVEAARAQREQTTLAMAMLDLNNFRFFNDAHGHLVGDGVLCLVAERLQQICRPYDTVVRFGGDEFALLLANIGGMTAEQMEARLRMDLSGLSYHVEEQNLTIPITISVGVALFPSGEQDRQEALQQADERLRRAKTGGDVETQADQVRQSARGTVEGFSMLDALVTAVDNKDRYTRQHSEDVMLYSLMIGQGLGLGEEEQRTIAVAALLHDVGKIGVPDAILRKPSTLTAEEYKAIKQHPTMGAALVSTVAGLEEMLDAVRHHHERWDGGGYPAGLKGEATPLIARLMSVADSFSAMTTDRPYRQGMNKQKALSILAAGAGTQWDAECIAMFVSTMEKTE